MQIDISSRVTGFSNQISKIMSILESALNLISYDQLVKPIIENIGPDDILLCIGKNALDLALAVSSQLKFNLKSVYVFQARGYTNISQNNDFNIHILPHPFPDITTINATESFLEDIKNMSNTPSIYCIISGGGSATFASPVEGLNVDDYNIIVQRAMAEGFSINRLNGIRSIIDKVKGGKLRTLIDAEEIYTYCVSDVPSNDPAIIASGPTIPGISPSNENIQWVQSQFKTLGVDLSAVELAKNLENKKRNVHSSIIASRKLLIKYVVESFEKSDFSVQVKNTAITEPVDVLATTMLETEDPNDVIIWMGEPTVEIPTKAMDEGQGGRVASVCCLLAEELEDPQYIFVGLATDGNDGSSPHPGYIITVETKKHLRPLGGGRFVLRNGNSGYALSTLGYGISLSTSSLNLNDLYLRIKL